MTQNKTKKALLMSVLSMMLCVAMLVGMTFAWFTDTASTSVNKIQAGNLKVGLEMFDATQNKWVDATTQPLTFKTVDDRVAEQILWEPGCTYELPRLRVINKGNLALKYKIQITGIQGDAKLNEAIEWTIGDVALGTEQQLIAGASNEFTISGHMKKEAGNEYQGLSIDGINITVYATQMASEFDSIDNQYDKDARYFGDQPIVVDGGEPVEYVGSATVNGYDGVLHAKNGAKVTLNANLTAEESEWTSPNRGGYAMAVWAKDPGTVVTITGGHYTQLINGTANQYDLIYASGGAKIVITGGTFKVGAGDPKWTLNCKDNSGSVITVMGGSFYKFDPSAERTDQEGEVVVAEGCKVVKNGDWYTVVPKEGAVAMVSSDSTSRYTLGEAVKHANAGDTVTLLDDAKVDEAVKIDKSLTINGDNHTVSLANNMQNVAASGQNTSRTVVFMNTGTNNEVLLKNMVLDGENKALGRTAVIDNASNLTIENVEIKNFIGSQLLRSTGGKSVKLNNVNIYDNDLKAAGTIQSTQGVPFDSGILMCFHQNEKVTFNNTTIKNNKVEAKSAIRGDGMLIYVQQSGKIDFNADNVTIENNFATNHILGTMYATHNQSHFTFNSGSIKNNSSANFFITANLNVGQEMTIESNIVINNDNKHTEKDSDIGTDHYKCACTLTNNGTIIGDISEADWAVASRGLPIYTGNGTHTGTKTNITVK